MLVRVPQERHENYLAETKKGTEMRHYSEKYIITQIMEKSPNLFRIGK